tara:strand:+ start:2423 stop:2608 length:186 start_codon:yes stop_codon:yes gene_type:complete
MDAFKTIKKQFDMYSNPTAGKGDKPRTVYNKKWRDSHDDIDWGSSKKDKKPKKKQSKSNNT